MPGGLLGSLVVPALVFAALYFPALTRFSQTLVSPYPKAELWKRFGAAMTDALIVATLLTVYQRAHALPFAATAALYLLLRDAVRGQSIGKLLFGLVAISTFTGKPASVAGAIWRNLLFVIPGANVAAMFLEAGTIVRDVQGQRLGDRIAQTQVVEGLGARDLAAAFFRWWRETLELSRTGRRKRRAAAVDP